MTKNTTAKASKKVKKPASKKNDAKVIQMESTKKIDLSELSDDEIEAALKQRREEKQKADEKKKEEYENHRENLINAVMVNAQNIHDWIANFKKELHAKFDEQAERLNEYGKIRSNSKGGFSITNKEGTIRITRTRSTEPVWDERSIKAIELINDFLRTEVQPKNKKLFPILMSFIEKNEKGDLEYNKVMNLVKHENTFDDSRWKEGLKLIKESFSTHLKGFSYDFKKKDANGNWQKVDVNFTSI